jgi:heme exporter protein B
MMGVLRGARLLALKDLRIELRTRDVLSSVGLFALLIVVVASFSFPTTGEHRELVAAGLLWMAFLFAMLLGIGRSVAIEHEDACVDGLVTSPIPRESIYLGKVLSNLAFVGAAQLVILPLAVALLQLTPGRGVWLLLVTVALGTVALVALATLLSTIAVNTRTREAILPVLVVPVAIPVLLAAIQASATALAGGGVANATPRLLLLVAAAALFLLLGLATFRHLLEE